MGKGDKRKHGRRNTAARSAKQVTRAELRQQDSRWQRAKAEQEEAEERLKKLKGGVAPSEYHGFTSRLMSGIQEALSDPKQVVEVKRGGDVVIRKGRTTIETIPMEGDGNGVWTLGQARSMLRQGYNVKHVVTTTGFGLKWFTDLPTDEDGYGLSTEEWVDELANRRDRKEGLSA